ncbi:sulfate adenylyltransferase subunit CysN [Mesorhizobium sp. CN5-321]|uniref:sulfate adenylyltransferase subunit CysN n=1 Tax=Mesorhizobium hunchu TaxID=3157708 RepID=UPI0032B73D07
MTRLEKPTEDAAGTRLGVYLATQKNKGLLRFLTCGSVDDGKSTLIGRLLYDTKLIFEDQLADVQNASRKFGTTGEDIDLALLVDGLEAEREQGITIDVAYRFFTTPARKFIVADTPGHEQYTRNMATGASTADLAVVLVDARKGVLPQTRRHSFIASLLGIRHVVVAVNKIDLIDFDRGRFEAIVADYRAFADKLGFTSIAPIPMSARYGDNVSIRSEHMPWYDGPTLIEHLEQVVVDDDRASAPFRFPIQYVNRPNLDFRGFAGTIATGRVAVGDAVRVAKSGKQSLVREILSPRGSVKAAEAHQAVTLLLEDEIELSRGNMLVAPEAPPEVSDQFTADIVWMDEHPLLPGRSYILRTETDQTPATVSELKYRVNIENFAHEAASSLAMNEIGSCNLSLQAPIAFDPYGENRSTGTFILIDRTTNRTIAAGMIAHGLRRATNVHWQALDVDRKAHAALKNQRPRVLWFTGMSGSGKSTIANLVEKKLHSEGRHTYILDGDNVRHGLNRDLGFTDADRVENIRRVAEVARLMADAGLIVIVSFISPFRSERRAAREIMRPGEFVEIFVDTPLEECIRRDPKGLYERALKGEIPNFTGISSPYEAPENAEIRLETVGRTPEEMAEAIGRWLEENQPAAGDE